MAGESQYYAPIIQAYLEATRGMQQQKNQEAEREQRQEALDRQEEQAQQQKKQQDQLLTQAQQRIDQEREWHHSEIENQTAARKAATDQAHLQTSKILAELIRNGMSPQAAAGLTGGQFQPGNPIAAQTAQQLQLPGGPSSEDTISLNGQQIPVSGIPTQAQQQATALADFQARAGVTAGANAAAEEPYKEKARKEQEAFQLKIAQMNGDKTLAAARINGQYHLEGIKQMHSLGLEDGSGQVSNMAKQLVDGVFNGTVDPSKLTLDQKRLASAYASANGETLPTNKTYATNLDNIGNLDTLLTQYRDLAQNYSKDSPGDTNNLLKRMETSGSLLSNVTGTSDLNAKQDALKAQAGLLAKVFEQQSRTSDANIVRQAIGSFDPKATVEENLGKLNSRFQDLNQVVKNTFPGQNTDRINSVLAARGITNLGVSAPQKKVATGADLLNYSRQKGVDLPTALKHATDAGYEVQPVGGLPGGVIPSPQNPTATAPGPTQ